MTNQRAVVQRHILFSALLVGSVAFFGGLLIPALFIKSNLAPMIGIIFGAPIGTIAGVMIGVVTARRKFETLRSQELFWFAFAAWCAAILYTMFTMLLAPRLAIPAIGLQVFVIGCFALLAFEGSRNSSVIRRYGLPVLLVIMGLAVVLSFFPPVRPRAGGATGSNAFVLDHRLDAARRVPTLVLNKRVLLAEFALLLTTAAVAATAMSVAQRHHGDTT